jgi:hypothetical protein
MENEQITENKANRRTKGSSKVQPVTAGKCKKQQTATAAAIVRILARGIPFREVVVSFWAFSRM